MEKKLKTNCVDINFILTEKFKAFELDGNVQTSFVFKKFKSENMETVLFSESEIGKIYFLENGDQHTEITFTEFGEIQIFIQFEKGCFSFFFTPTESDFDKIKKFFDEVETEINKNDGN